MAIWYFLHQLVTISIPTYTPHNITPFLTTRFTANLRRRRRSHRRFHRHYGLEAENFDADGLHAEAVEEIPGQFKPEIPQTPRLPPQRRRRCRLRRRQAGGAQEPHPLRHRRSKAGATLSRNRRLHCASQNSGFCIAEID